MKVTARTKKTKDGRQSYYLDIYHSGKRRYEFLSLYLTGNRLEDKQTRELVEKIRAKRQVEAANNSYGFVPEFKRKADVVRYFEEQIQGKEKFSIYSSTFKKLKAFCKGRITFQEIDEKWLREFQNFLLTGNLSRNTAREYFSVFKRILKLAVREKIIPNNPCDFIDHIKREDTSPDFLTVDEVQILATTGFRLPDVKRAFLFSCFTGLRFSDVKALTWRDVKPNHIEIRQTKTKEFLFVPLCSVAKAILRNEDSNVFQLGGHPVFTIPEKVGTNRALKRWFAIAGIEKNAHFHMSRHTFAVMNITSGAQLYSVSQLLGHKNMRTTEIYSKLIDPMRREAIDRLPVIEVR